MPYINYIYGMFWKNKRVICGIAATCVVVAVSLAVFCERINGDFSRHETLPLIKALDSANTMLVTPEGLGKYAKGKVIDGRTYQNFVQMLRLADAKESLQDTFHTECSTGLRVQLFNDTLPIAEFRIAEKIGRIGNDIGVWEPEKSVVMKKINQFMRNQGVIFRPCAVREDSTSMQDVLKSMIFESDTAIRTPLLDIVKNVDRATLSFPKILSHANELDKENMKSHRVELSQEQLTEFLNLLRDSKKESFAGGCLCLSKATVTMYRDSVEVLELKVFGTHYEQLEKHLFESNFGASGIWESSNPEAIESFFRRFNPQQKMHRDSSKVNRPKYRVQVGEKDL